MEELMTLREFLLQGDVSGALSVVDELEEMSKDDKINTISSDGVILLIHLMKQYVEQRNTRSWEVSIRNALIAIQKKNKRRKSGGFYLTPDEIKLTIEESYEEAINKASLEINEGQYSPEELEPLCDRTSLLQKAFDLITASHDHVQSSIDKSAT